MSVKYFKSETQTGWIGGGDRKGMELCSSGMAPLMRGLLSTTVFLLGKKPFGKHIDRFGKVKFI